MAITNPTRVVLGPKTRWSYVHLWEPVSFNGSDPKYSVSLIIPKDDRKTVEAVQAAIKAAYELGSTKLQGRSSRVPGMGQLKLPLRDGDQDRPDDPVYAGCYFINASSVNAPEIVDKYRQPVIDHNAVYSGVYGRASVSFYAFNSNGTRGIAAGLNNLQVLADGEPLGGHISAADEFADLDDEDDDNPFA